MLAFMTLAALWTSSVFHIGAVQALKSRLLNMSALVSLGILTSHLFSVGLTLFAPGQETFYEYAVMLAVFLLVGHWMEMKARRGSSDSVRKLLDLAPQTATVERQGRLVEIPVAEVVGGDAALRPYGCPAHPQRWWKDGTVAPQLFEIRSTTSSACSLGRSVILKRASP